MIAAGTLHGCGGSEEEQLEQLVCGELDKVTPQQWQRFFNTASAQLQAEGINFDRSVWTDPAKFATYEKRFRSIINCTEPTPAPLKRISGGTGPDVGLQHHSDAGPDDFCGPDHAQLKDVHVSNCLNRACFNHDSCYARCSEKTGGTSCSWNDYTKPCDDVFFAAAAACPAELGTIIRTEFVIAVATSAALLDRSGGCSAGTKCPDPGSPGFGPCALNRTGPECAACLKKNDPGSACFNKACFDPGPTPDICYTANCPGTDECFGWGKTGTGGAGGAAGTGSGGSAASSGSMGGSSGKGGGSGTGGSGGTSGGGTAGSAGTAGSTSTCKDSADVGGDLTQAKKLPSESDCDGSSHVSGIIDGKAGDADFYTYYGSDDSCLVDPSATISTPGLKFCMWSGCAYKYTCSFTTASPIGSAEGCCSTTPTTLSVSTDCDGLDDSTTIYMKVFADPGSAVCAAYDIKYHY